MDLHPKFEQVISFIEALAPVLRDHMPGAERDLALGKRGDSLHVDR